MVLSIDDFAYKTVACKSFWMVNSWEDTSGLMEKSFKLLQCDNKGRRFCKEIGIL